VVSPEQELLIKLAPRIELGEVAVVSEDDILAKMNQELPFCGSKIDWESLEDKVHWACDDLDSTSILAEVFNKYEVDLDAKLIVVGDSAMGSALLTDAQNLVGFIQEVTELPQHTYVLPLEMGWVLCYSMEGFVDAAHVCTT